MGFCGGLGARTGGVWRRVVCVHPRDDFSSVVRGSGRASIYSLSIYLSIARSCNRAVSVRSSIVKNTLIFYREGHAVFFANVVSLETQRRLSGSGTHH
jgi:hypothetical protein